MWRPNLLEKTDAEKDWVWEETGATGWDGWMASPIQWIWVWASSNKQDGEGQGGLVHCSSWGHKDLDMI